MGRYVARRLIQMAVVLLGVTALTFVVAQVVPGDPVVAVLGQHAREEQIEAMRKALGLDRPLLVQYGLYLRRLAAGDLGVSIRTRRPVAWDLRDHFPATLELALAALVVAVAVGIPAGIVSAARRGRWIDPVLRVGAVLGGSVPVFWTGLAALAVFYSKLGWVPGPGRLSVWVVAPRRVTGLVTVDAALAADWAALMDAAAHLVMPAMVLGLYTAALVARMTRGAVLDVLEQEFIRTARAKGVREAAVVLRHALKNALLPILTVVGTAFGSLLSGAVLTETIFSWPGLGRYATASAVNLDFPAVMGVALVAGVAYSLVNLAVDLLYAVIDPRIRYA